MERFILRRVHPGQHDYPEVIKEDHNKVYSFKRGQRVKVTDGSYNFDATTGKARDGIHSLFKNNTATIIETDCDRYIQSGLTDWIIQTDLLLRFDDGTKVYCASDCVLLI